MTSARTAGGRRLNGQDRRCLDVLQHKHRMHLLDAGQAADHRHGEFGIAVEIGRDHLQKEIGLAGDGITGDHRFQCADLAFEPFGLVMGMRVDLDADESEDAEANGAAIDNSLIAADDAGLFKPFTLRQQGEVDIPTRSASSWFVSRPSLCSAFNMRISPGSNSMIGMSFRIFSVAGKILPDLDVRRQE